MGFQNFNRLPIIDQTVPLSTFTVEQNVFGGDEEVRGWFIVEHSAIDNDTYIFPEIYADRQTAFAAMIDLTA